MAARGKVSRNPWFVGILTDKGDVIGDSANSGTSVQSVQETMHVFPAQSPGLNPGAGTGISVAERNHKALPVQFPKGPSPIKTEVLERWLQHYPRHEAASCLLLGFKVGFRIPVVGDRFASRAGNLRSINGMEDVVQAKTDKEAFEGRVLGHFDHPPVNTLRVSPLGLVLKNPNGNLDSFTIYPIHPGHR